MPAELNHAVVRVNLKSQLHLSVHFHGGESYCRELGTVCRIRRGLDAERLRTQTASEEFLDRCSAG